MMCSSGEREEPDLRIGHLLEEESSGWGIGEGQEGGRELKGEKRGSVIVEE